MAFCKYCGKELTMDTKYCPSCGKPTSEGATLNETFNQFTETNDNTDQFSQEDISKNKAMAVLSYLGMLVLVPILISKDSPYVKFHANQGLVLLIAEMIWGAFGKVTQGILGHLIFRPFAFLYWGVSGLTGVVSLIIAILAIVGIVNAATGKAKELPIVGHIHIYK